MTGASSEAARLLRPHPYRIERVTPEVPSGEIFSWELVPQDEAAFSRFSPGQFTMLYGFGAGEIPISISGDPAGGRLVQTLRATGSVTRCMLGYRAGDVVGVRGPFGTPWPMDALQERQLLVVAGGLGLAPLRPALYHWLRHRPDDELFLYYGARNPETLLYGDELQEWNARPNCHVEITVDQATPEWNGHVGVVTNLVTRGGFDPAAVTALVCGPEVMMRHSVLTLQQRGIAPENIYISMERHMQCAVGWCGHCQFGPHFVCRDGPVFRLDTVEPLFAMEAL